MNHNHDDNQTRAVPSEVEGTFPAFFSVETDPNKTKIKTNQRIRKRKEREKGEEEEINNNNNKSNNNNNKNKKLNVKRKEKQSYRRGGRNESKVSIESSRKWAREMIRTTNANEFQRCRICLGFSRL